MSVCAHCQPGNQSASLISPSLSLSLAPSLPLSFPLLSVLLPPPASFNHRKLHVCHHHFKTNGQIGELGREWMRGRVISFSHAIHGLLVMANAGLIYKVKPPLNTTKQRRPVINRRSIKTSGERSSRATSGGGEQNYFFGDARSRYRARRRRAQRPATREKKPDRRPESVLYWK